MQKEKKEKVKEDIKNQLKNKKEQRLQEKLKEIQENAAATNHSIVTEERDQRDARKNSVVSINL